MEFEIIKPHPSFLHPQVFLKKIACADHHEKNYCSQLIKRAARHQTRIHILANPADHTIIGFIAISASELKNSPCITIDYLFTTTQFRGVVFKKMGSMKASEYLINYAIHLVTQVNFDIPFRYIALQPAHDKLLTLYHTLGFVPLDTTGWLFLKINQ